LENVFGFANAGVPFAQIGPGTYYVLAALLLGKPTGILLFSGGARLAEDEFRHSSCASTGERIEWASCRSVEGRPMSTERLELPQGTLDLLILKVLSLEPMHGWAISERLRLVSKAMLQIPQGSIYPALHRLERRGWIAAEWGPSDNNRNAKYYELTKLGRKQLSAESDEWARLTMAVRFVLDMK
jgi:PadR family transcriptional regulator